MLWWLPPTILGMFNSNGKLGNAEITQQEGFCLELTTCVGKLRKCHPPVGILLCVGLWLLTLHHLSSLTCPFKYVSLLAYSLTFLLGEPKKADTEEGRSSAWSRP